MKTVTVKFTERHSSGFSQKEYDYLVDDDVEVTAGDYAVAHNGNEFAIVKVMGVKVGASAKATKTLVTILNENVLVSYNDMNQKVKEQKALFARLDQLMIQETENNKYRLLAASNAEAAKIIEQLGIK
jgi:RNA binding exosome subunit